VQIALVTASIISIYALGYDNKNDFPYLYPTGNDSTSVLPLWLEQWSLTSSSALPFLTAL
jgi:hypothetical protein